MDFRQNHNFFFSYSALAAFILCLFANYSFSQNPQIINFDKQKYKAARQNWSVTFDKDGTSYFGNNLGLLEFDGITWKLTPSGTSSIIRAVAADSNDRIYIGGYRELGYWKKDKEGNFKYNSLSNLVEDKFATNEEFWNIINIGNKICFHSFSGIFVYESGSFNVIKPGGFVNFATRLGDQLYFTIKEKGIYKLSDSSYIPVIESDFFIDKTVRFILKPKNQQLILIGTESNGIFAYNENTRQFYDWAPKLTNILSEDKINHGAESENGNIFIGTILDGLFIVDEGGNQLHHLNVENGLQSNTVLGLATDNFGNVWLALDKGIDFISFPESEAFKIVENDKLGALYSAAIYNNNLYIGTNQGLYRRSWLDDTHPFSLVPNTQEQVWDCQIIDNTLFVGHNSGTFVIKNNLAEKISNNSGGYSIVRHPQNPDILIQSTYSSLVVYSKSSGEWKFSHIIRDFNNLIRHLAIDHLNNIWASHLYLGVYKIRLNDRFDSIKTIKYYGKNSILGKEGRNSYVFKVENRIVFTTGKQLYTYNDLADSIVPYDILNKQLDNYSSSFRIVPAPEHRYWFINEYGCACFEIQHHVVKKIKEYPKALFDNQLIPNFENIIPYERDKAIVCLENGYAILDLSSPEQGDEILQQELQLREIISSDKHERTRNIIYSDKDISIPFNWNSLILRYSFPLFSGDKYSFHYKIVGLMDNWSEELDKPIINIKRIPPGKYYLSVKAVNRWGKASKIHTIKFTIKSPWYQSTPAYIIYTLIFAVMAFYSRYLTIKRVKNREKRKRIIKEREIVQLRNEKLRADISFKSQQLANSTMGIIKKNEFLISLKDKLKRQKEQLGTRYPDKYFQDIIKKIDKNITGEDDWQLFEFNFEQAHETFLLNLKKSYNDLTPSDLRLCAYLRINLTSKEIAPLLGVSVRGVENHRSRLRKKLNLSTETNLTEFILSL